MVGVKILIKVNMKYQNESSFKLEFIANFLANMYYEEYKKNKDIVNQSKLSDIIIQDVEILTNKAWNSYLQICKPVVKLEDKRLPRFRPKPDLICC
jgi:hypothetical protein